MGYELAEGSFYWISDLFSSIKDIIVKIFRTITIYGINFFVFIYNAICIIFKLKRRFLYWGDEFQKYNHYEKVTDQENQQRNHNPKSRTYKKPYKSKKRNYKKTSRADGGNNWREENRKREEELRKAQEEVKRAKRESRQAQEQAERQKQWANEEVRKAREEAQKQQANGQQQSTSQNTTQSKPQPDNRTHQEILGLNTPGFTKAELKQAYKRASAKYHPDKHAHMPQEFQDQASEEFKKVQRAYKLLQSVAV